MSSLHKKRRSSSRIDLLNIYFSNGGELHAGCLVRNRSRLPKDILVEFTPLIFLAFLVLRFLFLFSPICVLYPMVPLDCPFWVAPSVYSSVYLKTIALLKLLPDPYKFLIFCITQLVTCPVLTQIFTVSINSTYVIVHSYLISNSII